ncbi:MAG: hypothetical protein V1870_01300 [Candidatus Aenigmatarchaeota archaeon]
MTGWSKGFQELVEKNKVYPVTILNTDLSVKIELLKKDIITLQDVLSLKKSKMKNWDNIVEMAMKILGGRRE